MKKNIVSKEVSAISEQQHADIRFLYLEILKQFYKQNVYFFI
jgi:hypothetical protein